MKESFGSNSFQGHSAREIQLKWVLTGEHGEKIKAFHTTGSSPSVNLIGLQMNVTSRAGAYSCAGTVAPHRRARARAHAHTLERSDQPLPFTANGGRYGGRVRSP